MLLPLWLKLILVHFVGSSTASLSVHYVIVVQQIWWLFSGWEKTWIWIVITVAVGWNTRSRRLKILYTKHELFTKLKFTEYRKIIHCICWALTGFWEKCSLNAGTLLAFTLCVYEMLNSSYEDTLHSSFNDRYSCFFAKQVHMFTVMLVICCLVP
jgi:hypothetical protein